MPRPMNSIRRNGEAQGFPRKVVPRTANPKSIGLLGQSYLYVAGATFVATDEVEAANHRHGIVQRCYLRPHPSRFWRDTFPSRGRLWPVLRRSPYRPSSGHP